MMQSTLGLLLSSLMLFSSYVTLEMSMEVNEDESSTITYLVLVDSEIYTPGMFDELKQIAVDIGGTAEDYSSGEQVGVVIAESFNDFKDLMATYPTYDIDPNPRLMRFRAIKTTTLLKRRYSLELQVDTQELKGGIFDSSALGEMDFRHSVTLPGNIVDHNGVQVADNKVAWEIDAASGAIYILRAKSELGTDLPIKPALGLAILGTCGVIALIISGVGIVVSLRQQGGVTS
jgi:hypothetical protein